MARSACRAGIDAALCQDDSRLERPMLRVVAQMAALPLLQTCGSRVGRAGAFVLVGSECPVAGLAQRWRSSGGSTEAVVCGAAAAPRAGKYLAPLSLLRRNAAREPRLSRA